MSHQMSKFDDTNLTTAQFVEGLRRFSRDAGQLIFDWPTFDSDLQEEYLENLKWMIDKAADYIEKTGNK